MPNLRCNGVPLIGDGVLITFSEVGINRIGFPEAPALAIPITSKSAGLEIKDISRFEISEAFSVVVRIADQQTFNLSVSYDKIDIKSITLR